MVATEIILKEGEEIHVTTEEKKGEHIVLAHRKDGTIAISGNSTIVATIKGYGMRNKVED